MLAREKTFFKKKEISILQIKFLRISYITRYRVRKDVFVKKYIFKFVSEIDSLFPIFTFFWYLDEDK